MNADTRITMGVFYQSLPMMAAAERGFYAEHGLVVDHQKVTSSIQQAEYLRDGKYDVVQTSPDNVANYRLNANNPVGETIDMCAFIGMDYGMYLVVAARPGINAIDELRGKLLAVDAPASGFAYVLYKILRTHGLERDEDYEIVAVGGVADRYAALLNGDFDATLLSGGFETRAANAGYRLLDSVYDIATPYLGVVGAARDSWLETNRALVVRLIRAYRAATDWSLDPVNREAAIDLLAGLPNTDRGLAEQLYDVQQRPGVGIVPDAGIDLAALANVMALRAEFDGFEEPQDVQQLAGQDGGLFTLKYFEESLDG